MEEEFFSTYHKVNKKREGIPGFRLNTALMAAPEGSKGDIGIELELEGLGIPQMRTGHFERIRGSTTGSSWLAIEDGSLRSGREFVLSAPCDKDEVKYLVGSLFEELKNRKCNIINSNRCSTHVHINIRNKKINHLTSIIALWYILEQPLLKWQGEERQTNHFALSLKDCDSTLKAWYDLLSSGTLPRGDGLKYSGLNILPIWRQGSVEFRAGKASDSSRDPIVWAKFLYNLVEYASTTYPNPEVIAYVASERSPLQLFEDICSKDEDLSDFCQEVIALSGDDFNKDCMEGLRNCQGILLGFPWSVWMEKIDTVFVPNPFEKPRKAAVFNRIERGPLLAPRVGLERDDEEF